MNHYIKLIIAVFLLIILQGCKVSKNTKSTFKNYPKSPASFTSKIDSLAAELPHIAEIYSDPLLRALIDSAMANNFELQKFREKINILGAGLKAVKGNNLPDLNAFLGVSGRRFGKYTIDGVGNFDTNFSPNISDKQKIPKAIIPDFNGGLISNWEIDMWKKLENQRKAAFLRFGQGEHGQNFLKTLVVAEIASAYFDLLIFDKELEAIEESIILQQRALDIISAMKDAGESSSLAVELSSAQVLAAKALKIEIEQGIIDIENNLNFLIGRYPQTIARRDINTDNMSIPNLTSGSPVQLLNNRPDIKEAELALLASNADVHVARVAFYPSINIGASVGLQSFRLLNFLSPTSFALNTLGMGLMPLINQRQLQANLLASGAEQQIAYLNYQEKVMSAFNDVNKYIRKLQNTEQIIEIKTEEVELLARSINTSSELFKYGKATYLEVITAQRIALSAQIELLNIKRNQYDYNIALYRALGGGWK